jgi:hypothetical protein
MLQGDGPDLTLRNPWAGGQFIWDPIPTDIRTLCGVASFALIGHIASPAVLSLGEMAGGCRAERGAATA